MMRVLQGMASTDEKEEEEGELGRSTRIASTAAIMVAIEKTNLLLHLANIFKVRHCCCCCFRQRLLDTGDADSGRLALDLHLKHLDCHFHHHLQQASSLYKQRLTSFHSH